MYHSRVSRWALSKTNTQKSVAFPCTSEQTERYRKSFFRRLFKDPKNQEEKDSTVKKKKKKLNKTASHFTIEGMQKPKNNSVHQIVKGIRGEEKFTRNTLLLERFFYSEWIFV